MHSPPATHHGPRRPLAAVAVYDIAALEKGRDLDQTQTRDDCRQAYRASKPVLYGVPRTAETGGSERLAAIPSKPHSSQALPPAIRHGHALAPPRRIDFGQSLPAYPRIRPPLGFLFCYSRASHTLRRVLGPGPRQPPSGVWLGHVGLQPPLESLTSARLSASGRIPASDPGPAETATRASDPGQQRPPRDDPPPVLATTVGYGSRSRLGLGARPWRTLHRLRSDASGPAPALVISARNPRSRSHCYQARKPAPSPRV
jgi:hypothetical protein